MKTIAREILRRPDLRPHWKNLCYDGVSLVPNMINKDFLRLLIDEVAAGPFTEGNKGTKLVQQKFDSYAYLFKAKNMPFVNLLLETTKNLINAHGAKFISLAKWNPVDIVVQKYGSDGFLTAHQDLARHPGVIVSFTLTGRCQFDVLESRNGPVIKTVTPQAGDMLLLRAPGLFSPGIHDKRLDERPFHRLTGSLLPDEPRIALTFRDNDDPFKYIQGFGYLNQEKRNER